MVLAKESVTLHFPVLKSGSRGRKWEKGRKNEGKEVAVGL